MRHQWILSQLALIYAQKCFPFHRRAVSMSKVFVPVQFKTRFNAMLHFYYCLYFLNISNHSHGWEYHTRYVMIEFTLKLECINNEVVNNFLSAIASTNAVIAGLIVFEAFKILEEKWTECRHVIAALFKFPPNVT